MKTMEGSPFTVFHDCIARLSPEEIEKTQQRFQAAAPFPHTVLDNFFTPEFAETLHQDFPKEDENYQKFCMGDGGKKGPSYANCNPVEFPPAYKRLDALIQSQPFRDYISAVTGIEGLEYDPDYFGGGIRESRPGTFLPPHIDFNHHPKTSSHRRLNLLFYLNKGWEKAWGGNLEVHLDPRVHKNDSLVASYEPICNRCLIFETSEISWHAFDRLKSPPGIKRRAFTVYYYTKDRPNSANIKLHNTEYVELALPPHLRAGYILTEDDVKFLMEGYARRDGRIEMLYKLRADFDHKWGHLWKEYEYYLDLSRTLQRQQAS